MSAAGCSTARPAAAATIAQPDREGEGLRSANASKHQPNRLAAADLRAIASWRTDATSIGGIRWCRATPIPCIRPASRCAGGWARARTTSRTTSSRTASSAGPCACRRRRASGPVDDGRLPALRMKHPVLTKTWRQSPQRTARGLKPAVNRRSRPSLHGPRAVRDLALAPVPRLDAPRLAPRAGARREHARSAYASTGLSRSRRRAPHRCGRAPHHAARRARPGDGRDRAADHRRQPRRHRQHVVGRDRQSPVRDGGDPPLRQALRHSRPARHVADRHRHLRRGLARLRAGAVHAGAHFRPRAAGAGRRRPDAVGADHHRRRRLPARSAALSGLHVVDLHRVHGGRPDRRRLHRRAPALVVDFLAQPAALRAGLFPHSQRSAALAAARACRTSSTSSVPR